jgi:DNA-binding transcriptional LysR family regulator
MHLDLNLLTALDALLEESSVTAAADRLHLSAPAMSRALGRIRKTTGDQILVRTGRTMVKTPFALAVREQVREIVHQADSILAPDRELDLDTLDRVFTLQCHDAIITAIGPTLLASVQRQAPGVRLRLLAEASTDTDDLRRGHIDLELGASVPASAEIRHENAGDDRLVVAFSPDHPLAAGPFTLARYAEASHVTVSRRGRVRDPLDDAIAAHGLERRVVAAAPTSVVALSLASQGPFVVAVPRFVCGRMVRALGLCTAPLPLDFPPVPIVAAWHQRYESDQAHAWLRRQVSEALREVCSEPSEQDALAAESAR